MVASSLAFAGSDSDVIQYVEKRLSKNSTVKINHVEMVDTLQIPGVKE